MTVDSIIEKYGTHELDLNFCINNGMVSTIYAYCHKHNVDGQFMVNHYLKIDGKFTILKSNVDDESDVFIHIAVIEKTADGHYEISGLGGFVKFFADSNLLVEELSEDDYNRINK